ncbi:NKG2-A/NKG2-B type II integral membrane protein [Lemmus lemmus]
MELSLHNASQKHLKINRNSHCKKILLPPEKLISGILGIVWFALLVTLVIMTTVPFSCKHQTHPFLIINNNFSSEHHCDPCPNEWMSYSHSCYYVSVEKKNWTDSLVSCKEFLQSLSHFAWTSVFRESRDHLWVWKKDSTFKPK